MGHVSHQALVVTCLTRARATDARSRAIELGLDATNICEAKYNTYYTFLVPTSGSKYGWAEAIEHEKNVAALIRTLSDVEWVYVSYGYEDGAAEVLGHYKSPE